MMEMEGSKRWDRQKRSVYFVIHGFPHLFKDKHNYSKYENLFTMKIGVRPDPTKLVESFLVCKGVEFGEQVADASGAVELVGFKAWAREVFDDVDVVVFV